MNLAAAIKRASQQARNAMYDLDKRGMAELLAIYEEAGREIKAKLAAAVDASDMVPVHQLQDLLRQVEAIVDGLASKRNDLVIAAVDDAATLGVRPFTTQGVLAVGGSEAVLTSGAATAVHERAVQFVMEFVYPDGLTISDRLWRLDRGAKEALTRAIGMAVVQGQSATTAAQQLIMRGDAVPSDVAQRLAGGRLPALTKAVDLLTNPKGGDGYWQAERVMRTEINRAHGEAFMAAGEETPGFGGWRYLLSPLHPAPDICFRAGTVVTTQRGPVPIEQVQIGDQALTHLGRWRPVVRLYRSASGQSGLVRLCFQGASSRSQEVVMTPNHPVLTPSGWTAAGDLRTGSPVVCLDARAALPPPPCAAGAGHRVARGSGETASTSEARKTGPEQCDGRDFPACCTAHRLGADWLLPTGSPSSGVATRLWSCFRRAMRGCLAACAGRTAIAGTEPNVETCQGAAGQSSGCQAPSLAGMPGSNISGCCCSCLQQSSADRFGTPAAWWRALFGSTQKSKKCAPGWLPSTAPLQTLCRTADSQAAPACHDFSTGQHTRDCKNASLPSAPRAPIVLGWVPAVWHSVRKALLGSCAHHMLFRPQHATVDRLAKTGEPVFNLEVEDDHSYVANGLVVHNCDLLSTQNLHGLGPGVYPDRESVPWPAHPNTLSFLEIVFKSEITDADRAGKETALEALQRLGPDKRAGALGQTKAAYFDQGLLRTGMIRAPLYAVEQRLTRQGKL